jgi:hypothetical protein
MRRRKSVKGSLERSPDWQADYHTRPFKAALNSDGRRAAEESFQLNVAVKLTAADF